MGRREKGVKEKRRKGKKDFSHEGFRAWVRMRDFIIPGA